MPATMPGGSPWPKISIVTPSFNQGDFIEETIRSVLLQGYPNLEYIIIDGGSTDQSVEIIEKYEPWVTYWVSEPDRGQTHAINKGFERASGDLLAWLNSDDYYTQGCLRRVALCAGKSEGQNWIVGTTTRVDEESKTVNQIDTKSADSWLDFYCTKRSGLCLPQPSSFISRAALEAVGKLNEELNLVMDFELWGRLARAGFRPRILPKTIAAFRIHGKAKTSAGRSVFWHEEGDVIRDLLQEVDPPDREQLARYLGELEERIREESRPVPRRNIVMRLRRLIGRLLLIGTVAN